MESKRFPGINGHYCVTYLGIVQYFVRFLSPPVLMHGGLLRVAFCRVAFCLSGCHYTEIQATLSIFFGQRSLQCDEIRPDKKKKLTFQLFYYFFLRHGSPVFLFISSSDTFQSSKLLKV